MPGRIESSCAPVNDGRLRKVQRAAILKDVETGDGQTAGAQRRQEIDARWSDYRVGAAGGIEVAARAAAHDRLAIAGGRPGEAQRRRKVPASEQPEGADPPPRESGVEERGLREVVVERVRLVGPCEADSSPSAGGRAPGIAGIETIEIEHALVAKARHGDQPGPTLVAKLRRGSWRMSSTVVNEAGRGIAGSMPNSPGRPERDLPGPG